MNNLNEIFECRGRSAQAAFDGRFALPGASPHYGPDRTFDTQHIRLDLSVDIPRKQLKGVCTTTLQAVALQASTMVFNAVDFKIQTVSSKGKQLKYDYNKRELTVHFPKAIARGTTVEVSIAYQVTSPKLGLHFIGPDKAYPTKPVQVWTQGEDEYNRFWFPCHDAPQERTTNEMIVTVPEKFTAVSNGALVKESRNTAKKTKTFHWKQAVPHSPYLISLVVSEFVRLDDKWRKTPVYYYVPKGKEGDALRAFSKTPKMMEFFSNKLGVPYAYAKYAQTAAYDFIYGGMENTSCTTQTALTLHDERAHLDFSSDPLVAHELAHQWFGDLVTCKDWSHAWLNESFATYFEALFKEHDMGYDEFMYELYQNAEAYLDEDKDRYRRPMVTRNYKNTNDLFDRHLYEKGSLILHMLRNTLGDDAFWASMKLYLSRHRTQNVETPDLINAIQDATGKNLRPFFDQWIYRGGHPEFKLRTWWDASKKEVNVRVLQTHAVTDETPLFKVSTTFALLVNGKWARHAVRVEKKDQLLTFQSSQAPELVLFDPDHILLKRVQFTKPETMWISQLQKDPHILGRRQAAESLAQFPSATSAEALAQTLLKDPFWAVQAEAARSLGKLKLPQAREALLQALDHVSHPKVRRGIWEGLGSCVDWEIAEIAEQRFSSEASYFAEAEAIRTWGKWRDAKSLPQFKELLKRDSWNDVLRISTLEAIASLRLPESVEILKSYTRYGNHPNTRMTAIRLLGSLGHGREDIQRHLLGVLEDSYLLVKLAVVRVLGQLADERAVPELMVYTQGDWDGRLKRTAEEAVRKIRKGMDSEFPEPKSKGSTK